MTVIHIAYRYGLNNTGGAMIAATRLHQALQARGVDSHFVCIWKDEEGTNVHQLPTGWFSRRLFFLLTKITRCVWKFSCHRKSIPLNIIPLFGLERLLKQIKPDVVHVHWIYSDVCAFEQLEKLPYRLVFHLHDLYMLNGLEVHPVDDNRFVTGFTKENASWVERWLFDRKRKLMAKAGTRFIAPSEWVASMSRKSVIGRSVPVDVVGNIPGPTVGYAGGDGGRAGDRFVILFGAWGGRANKFKGFADLVQALALLPESVKADSQLNVFGESSPDCETAGVRTRFLGQLKTAAEMAVAYSTADVYAFPSTVETQGMTKIEALLYGLPVVAFNRTACAEGLVEGTNARVALSGDYAAFAAGLVHYYNEWKSNRLESQKSVIAADACRTYYGEAICEAMCHVYGKVA